MEVVSSRISVYSKKNQKENPDSRNTVGIGFMSRYIVCEAPGRIGNDKSCTGRSIGRFRVLKDCYTKDCAISFMCAKSSAVGFHLQRMEASTTSNPASVNLFCKMATASPLQP